MQENSHIEFKRELTDSLEKEVVAFLNYKDGGVIYIGIDKSGAVIGVTNSDDIQLKLKDRIKNNISPSTMGLFDVVAEMQEDKYIVKIIVASGSEKPYYLSKMGMSTRGCYIRIGSASEPMPERMIEDLFARRIRNSIGTIKSRYQDLTFEQLRIYYSEAKLNLNEQFAKNLELLTEDGKYNYAAYMLSDMNGVSIKFGKYSGLNRIDLIENEEYGMCCLIKATKSVLEKLRIENKTFTKITDTVRIERKLLDPTALREAIINAIIHNDYSNEIPPKFELFADRLEITSSGTLPPGFNQEDFFLGYSVPQNKELMRVFKDLDLVEHMGSGVPRILEAYPTSIYHFSQNFIRVTLPFDKGFEQTTEQVPSKYQASTEQVMQILQFCVVPKSTTEIMQHLGLSHREHFRSKILLPLIEQGLLTLTIPDKPNSSKQKYITIKNE
jgi:predicted HTH transcriptional regulator